MAETALDFDVVVAGAGSNGSTLALALAQGGMSVALVDPKPLDTGAAANFDGRAYFIAYGVLRQWRALGLGEALARQAQPVREILVTDGPGPGAAAGAPAPVFLRFDADDLGEAAAGEPLGWMLESRHIRAALTAGLQASGVTVLAPAEVAGIATTPGAAEVRLADGRVLKTPLLVGAEGRRSAVREAAGIGAFGWGYPQVGVVATVALARPHQGVAHEYFTPGGPLAILPLPGDRASLVWSERARAAEALMAGSDAAFEAHLARRFGDFLGRPKLVGPRASHPLGLNIAEAMVAPRTALVGDAAHVVHPVAGQGLNMGLKDVAALAEVVVDAARLGEDWGSPVVLERYQRWRRFDSATLAVATDLFVRVFSNDDPLLRLARGAGLALVNRIAPARRFFARDAGADLGEVPRLLQGRPL
jgi:2-octaprenyl-6-methoxyphenol hydroxylase